MSASRVSTSQPMSEGRINFNAPLKSVRTRRTIAPQEPPKLSFDGSEDGRTSPREGDVKRPGISFMWENAPGKPKIEEKEELSPPAELKPPPQSLPPTKAKDAAVSFTPPPAGTPLPKLNPFGITFTTSSLPPKPSPPPSRTTTMIPQQTTTDRTPPRSRPVAPIAAPPARRSSTPTRQSRSGDNNNNNGPKIDGLRNGSSINPVERERNGNGPSIPDNRDSLRGASHHYLSERLRQAQAPPAQKDFYVPTRSAPSATVQNNSSGSSSPYAATQQQPNSRLATRPTSSSRDNSEAGSHSSAEWDGEHHSDAGDIYSQMDHYQAQCQVSMLDGCLEPDLHDTSRHTDPRARDFIMQRFLPAAKAMVTESPDSNDRRSPTGTPTGSPRKGTRATAAGRSRFATFKEQCDADEEEAEEEDQSMLFKCKFPWQVSTFGSMCLPAPHPQPGVSRGKGDGKPEENYESAWTNADTEGSISKDEVSRSFENRGLPMTFRTRSGSSINTDGDIVPYQRDHDTLDHSQSFSVDSQGGDYYEGEASMRSNDSRRAYGSVPRDRFQETATHRESPPPRRKPEEFTGNLGMLLRTSNQNGKGMAKLVQPTEVAAEAEARKQQALADSSILNHHRYQSRQQMTSSGSLPDLRARDVDPNPFQSRLHGSASSSSPAHPNASSNEEGANYSRHLRQSLYKQDTGGSGRSLESIDDEAWEAIDREPTSSTSKTRRDDYYEQQRSDRSGLALTSGNSTLSDITDDARAIGWPLGKAYSAFSRIASNESKSESTYTRTPSTDSKPDSSYSRTPSTDSKNGSSYMRTASTESKTESAYTRTASNDSKYDSSYMRTPSSDSKHESPYARTPSTDSKNESFSSFSDHSPRNYNQQKESSSDKFSPVSVLQPPLPRAPRESWLGKLMPPAPAPLSNMSNWQQAGPKKFLEHSITDDSMDVKWEALVKSENAHVRNLRLAQDSPFSTNNYGGT